MKPLVLIILSLTLLTSCFSPQVYDISCAPSELPECPVVSQPIRVALVLGGGGAKGLAHVGAIEELVKANIPIDLVVGCSAGSIVGALYCDNPCTESLKEMLLTLKPNLLIDFDIWNARYGLCQGKSLRRFLYRNLRSKTFEELKKPFYLVATDLYSSELVTIGGGPLVPAIEASSSIPFVFVPVYLHGRAFVDGGVIDPIPVRVAKEFDAEVIIAVDLRGMLPKTFPRNLFGVAKRSAEITLLWQSEICLSQADVVVRPELCGIGTFENDQNERIYEAGRTAVKEMLPQILNLLKERGIEIEPSSCP